MVLLFHKKIYGLNNSFFRQDDPSTEYRYREWFEYFGLNPYVMGTEIKENPSEYLGYPDESARKEYINSIITEPGTKEEMICETIDNILKDKVYAPND